MTSGQLIPSQTRPAAAGCAGRGVYEAVAARQGAAVGGGTLPPSACRRLVAPVHAALRASGLNARPFYLAALIVEASLARGRQYIYVLHARQLGELLQFKGRDISQLLNGYDKVDRESGEKRHVIGLIEAKFVRLVNLSADRGWLLVVNPDWSRWAVPMMHSPAAKAHWLGVVDAQARELERQLMAQEIEWQFPDLTALLSAVDVENALKLVDEGKGYVVAASSSPAANALSGREQTNWPGVSRPSCGVAAVDQPDALKVPERNDLREDVTPCSDIPNLKTPVNRAGFGYSEPSLSLKTKGQRLKINLKCWTSYSIEQKKQALIELADCTSDDRVRVLLNTILGDDVTDRDGGKWIKARWTQRAKVQTVMEMVVERMGHTHLNRVNCAGRLAHSYGQSTGVNFSRNLLKHQL